MNREGTQKSTKEGRRNPQLGIMKRIRGGRETHRGDEGTHQVGRAEKHTDGHTDRGVNRGGAHLKIDL